MRRDLRLERILDAGARLLAERGLFGCTMRAVATLSGGSVANLYRYVRGKEELLYLVQERVLERALRSAEAARTVRGGREQLRSLLTDHIRRVLAFPAEARLLQEPADGLPDPLRRRLDELRGQYNDALCEIVQGAARPQGQRRAATERQVQLLLGMADRVALDAARSEPRARPDRLAAPVLELFHNAQAPRPGARRRP